MQKNYILLIISLIFCSNISFSQQYDFITPDNSVPIIDVESLVGESLVVESCTIDSIHVYDNYSVAVLYSTDTSAVSRTIVSDLSLISISKKDWEKVTCKIWITRMHPLMGELNPCETTYFAIASDENGPLYLNTNEQPNCEIYYLDSIECIVNEQAKYINASSSMYDAIQLAIDDFVDTSMGKDSNVVAVHVFWELDSCENNNIICVGMFPQYKADNVNKYPIDTLKNRIGTYSDWLPTACIEKCGKLFFWNNSNIPINSKVIEMLIKYEQVYQHGEIEIITTDGEHWEYYFCKNNHKQFKKIKTDWGVSPPCLKCGE